MNKKDKEEEKKLEYDLLIRDMLKATAITDDQYKSLACKEGECDCLCWDKDLNRVCMFKI